MRFIEKTRILTGRFAADRGGNFMVIGGVAVTALMMAVGLAVNVAQSYHLKSSLRSALDAAVTSTAYRITTGKISVDEAQNSVERFLNANGDASFSTQGQYTLLPLIIDRTARTIEASAYANVALAFPLFGARDPRVSISSAARYQDKQIEVAMMLDVTGSMKKSGKIDKIGDLKKAATNAVNTMLLNQDASNPRVRVALVPYASGVNAGGLLSDVFAEKTGGADLPPLSSDPRILVETGDVRKLPSYAKYKSIVGSAFKHGDNCATERKKDNGDPDLSGDAPDTVRYKEGKKEKSYFAMINRDNRLSGNGLNKCPKAQIVPLTADSESLLDSIDDFKADGFTAGAIAIQWTYYMLSHKWQAAISDAKLGTGPIEYDSRRVSKVAILMTDGQFNTAFAGVSDDANVNNQGSKSRSNAEALCRNMRNDHIEIYTIGFDLDNAEMSKAERDAAKGVLRNCASEDTPGVTHYFEASTGEQLDAAFQSIIANNEKVVLTK